MDDTPKETVRVSSSNKDDNSFKQPSKEPTFWDPVDLNNIDDDKSPFQRRNPFADRPPDQQPTADNTRNMPPKSAFSTTPELPYSFSARKQPSAAAKNPSSAFLRRARGQAPEHPASPRRSRATPKGVYIGE